MKPMLQYVLASLAATVFAFFGAVAVAAPQAPYPSDYADRVTEENVQADQALVALAHETRAKYGDKAFPAAMAVQLSTLSALCRGVDVALLQRGRKQGEPPAPHLQTTNMQMLQVKHPLCRRLTATAI